MHRRSIGLVVLALLSGVLAAADDDPADLRLRLPFSEVARYAWTISSVTESKGREMGKPFTLTSDSTFAMTLVLKGLPRKGDTIPVSVRLQEVSIRDKKAISAESSVELFASKSRVKCTENGKVVVDSDNDIGLDRMADFQQPIKQMETAEIRSVLDAAGRQSDIQGDAELVDTVKSSSHSIFPILAGKPVKPGESWEDSFEIPQLEKFKLARPAVVRSKMTFVKWQEKDGQRLAYIEVVSAWEKQDLRGENAAGMLVEITKVDGRTAGTCLFDPATGRFVEGSIEVTQKYRIDGERDGQAAGLDVSGKTTFAFALKKEK
jgi:hypothetical protein